MLTGFFQDSDFSCFANRIRIRVRISSISWIRTGVGLKKDWLRTPLLLTWLIVHEWRTWNVSNNFESVTFNLDRYFLKYLVVQGVRAIELQDNVLLESVFDAANDVLCFRLCQLSRIWRLEQRPQNRKFWDSWQLFCKRSRE